MKATGEIRALKANLDLSNSLTGPAHLHILAINSCFQTLMALHVEFLLHVVTGVVMRSGCDKKKAGHHKREQRQRPGLQSVAGLVQEFQVSEFWLIWYSKPQGSRE